MNTSAQVLCCLMSLVHSEEIICCNGKRCTFCRIKISCLWGVKCFYLYLFTLSWLKILWEKKKKRINIIAFCPSLENLCTGSAHFRNYNLNIYGHLQVLRNHDSISLNIFMLPFKVAANVVLRLCGESDRSLDSNVTDWTCMPSSTCPVCYWPHFNMSKHCRQ